MPKTAADVDEDFVDDSADDGSTSDSSSEEDDSEAVTRREGRPPSRVYDDPEYMAWRLHGVAARCGQDAKRLGIVFVDGARLQAEGQEEIINGAPLQGRRPVRSRTPTPLYDARPASCFKKTVATPVPSWTVSRLSSSESTSYHTPHSSRT